MGIIMGLSAIYNGLNGNILQLYAELSLYLLLIYFLVGTLAYIMLQMHVLEHFYLCHLWNPKTFLVLEIFVGSSLAYIVKLHN